MAQRLQKTRKRRYRVEELVSLEEQKKLKEYEEPEELKKLGKYPHRSFREIRAGEAQKALAREGGVADNSVEEIADNFTEEDAAVLERLQHSSKRPE